MPFFDKELSKAIMTRTKLHNNFLQNKSEENGKLYANKVTFVSLLRKTEKRSYENLNEKSVTDDKLFWKTIKLFLPDKTVDKNKIHLTEKAQRF